MRRIRIIYHVEADGAWAESPDAPGYSAFGETLEQVRALVEEGVPLFVGEPVELVEISEAPSMVDDLRERVLEENTHRVESEDFTFSWEPETVA